MAEVSRTDIEGVVHLCTWYGSKDMGHVLCLYFQGLEQAHTFCIYLLPFNTLEQIFINSVHLVLFCFLFFFSFQLWLRYTPDSSVVKNLTANAGDAFPGSGRSPAEGTGDPPPFSFLENSKHRGAWQDIVHGVRKNRI